MIRYVTKNDEGQLLSMMELVKDDFAGYKEKEFQSKRQIKPNYKKRTNSAIIKAKKVAGDDEDVNR